MENGRQLIHAQIVKTELREHPDFGPSMKMTVQTEDGVKLWGSLPRNLTRDGIEPGQWIEFTGTVELKKPDFGFVSRPAKAVIFEKIENEESF